METRNVQANSLRRYADGLYTKDEANKLFEQLAHPGTLEEVSHEMDSDWDNLKATETSAPNREELIEEAQSLLERIKGIRVETITPYQGYKRMAAFVAIALLCLTVTLSLFYIGKKSEYVDPILVEAITSAGEQKELILPDGTFVTLNACSVLKYPKDFCGDSRNVELKGEAFFNVNRNEAMPFIINTRLYDVRVLGTQFNVKIYDEDESSSVSVESGKVQLDMPDAMVRLTADERITLNSRSGEMTKEIVRTDASGWRSNNLVFDRTPLRDVANALERKYNCRIGIDDTQNITNLITGELSKTTLDSALQTICFISGLTYTIDGNNIEIKK